MIGNNTSLPAIRIIFWMDPRSGYLKISEHSVKDVASERSSIAF